jgi:geranylgeranyl diphosphate synthase type II
MLKQKELDNIIDEKIASLDLKGVPSELYDPINYLVSTGGKRIRPKFAITTYNIFSDKIDDSILLPAIALEIFHGFTLIHDDIMDKAPVRRGNPTVHRKWNDNIAILSGDVMCIKSYEYLANAPKERLPQVLKLFTKTAAEVCEGQQFDMNFENLSEITMEEYKMMIGLKTAVLIACSAKLGAIIGGADEKIANILYDFAYQMGFAFQIKDDYLDTFGSTQSFGKEIGGDILNNKKTWLLVEAMHKATPSQKERIVKLLNDKKIAASEKIEQMTKLYEETGVKESAEKAIKELHTKGVDILKNGNLNQEHFNVLIEFADNLIFRSK